MKTAKAFLAQKAGKGKKYDGSDLPLYMKIILYVITTMMSVSTIIPLMLTASISFTDDRALSLKGFSLIPSKFSTEAYKYVIKNGEQIWRAYGVTIFVTVVGTILGLLAMTLFSYAISRKSFPWSNQFAFFVFFTMLFNGGMVTTYIMVSNVLHLRDTIWALILPPSVNAMYIMILRTYMRTSIPEAVVESAKIDGAGEFLCYYRIVLPMTVPVIATIALFMSVNYWNGWYHAFLYIVKNKYIVPIQLLLKRIENDMNFLAVATDSMNLTDAEQMRQALPTESFKMALVIMVVVPILITYPFFQKFFVKGITIGAVKG